MAFAEDDDDVTNRPWKHLSFDDIVHANIVYMPVTLNDCREFIVGTVLRSWCEVDGTVTAWKASVSIDNAPAFNAYRTMNGGQLSLCPAYEVASVNSDDEVRIVGMTFSRRSMLAGASVIVDVSNKED